MPSNPVDEARIVPTVHHIVDYGRCFECGGGIGLSHETGEWLHLFDLDHKAAPEDEEEGNDG